MTYIITIVTIVRSVVTISRPHIAINDNINMCLMKRLRSSVVALPVKQWTYEYSTNLTSIDGNYII